MFEGMPDPNFQKTLVQNALEVSMPYKENVYNAAWQAYPANNDWNAFYDQQMGLIDMNYKTNNVFFDTFVCVRDLIHFGVIYPLPEDPSKMPPEQVEIMMEQMRRAQELLNQQ